MNKLSHQPTLKSAATSIAGRGLLAAALVIGVPSVVSAQPTPRAPRSQLDEHFQLALTAYNSGDYTTALSEFQTVRGLLPPNSPHAYSVDYNINQSRYYLFGAPQDMSHPIHNVDGTRARLSLAQLEAEPVYAAEAGSFRDAQVRWIANVASFISSLQQASRELITIRQQNLTDLVAYYGAAVTAREHELSEMGIQVPVGDAVSHDALATCESINGANVVDRRTTCRRALSELQLCRNRLGVLQRANRAISQRLVELNAQESVQNSGAARVAVVRPDPRVTVSPTPPTTRPNIVTHWLPLAVGGVAGITALALTGVWVSSSSEINAAASRCAAPGQPTSPCSRQEINDVLARNEPSVLPGVAIALGVVGVAGVVTFFATPARVPVSTSTTVPTTPRPRVNRAFILPSEGGAMVGVGGTF